jgi:tRNA threonylcarbamoyladenosine biosynthesis protein TsaE
VPPTSRFTAPSVTETVAAGQRLGEVAEAGDVLLLTGALGAGKTVLVQGLAAGMGAGADVASPTFVLVRQYQGRLELVHADLYRVEGREEAEALGLLELSAAGVLAVEWADRAPWLSTPEAARLHLAPGADEASRQLLLEGGPRRLHEALLRTGRRSP